MKNILLVFTGGTIGSQEHHGILDTSEAAGFKLIQLFQQHHAAHASITFKTLKPRQILSENAHPQFWQDVIRAIEAEDLAQFDGIIVTHGTDTLAFSAAVLGIYFHSLNIPMLLVSSNLPLDNPQANGLTNFICAVDYIAQRRLTGVFVPYQNPGQTLHLHIATRLSSCLPLSGDFISVQSKPYSSYKDGTFTALHDLPKRTAAHALKNQFARILLIKPYPGLDYRRFNLDSVDAVLHDLYHSGTACASDQWGRQHSLIDFSQHCLQRGIPLYLAPAIKGDAEYNSTHEILTHGGKMIWNTSIESAYAKLSLAYGSFTKADDIEAFLASDVGWEIV